MLEIGFIGQLGAQEVAAVTFTFVLIMILSRSVCDEDMHRFLADKMVALDRDKAEFCYLLCRSLGAVRVV